MDKEYEQLILNDGPQFVRTTGSSNLSTEQSTSYSSIILSILNLIHTPIVTASAIAATTTDTNNRNNMSSIARGGGRGGKSKSGGGSGGSYRGRGMAPELL